MLYKNLLRASGFVLILLGLGTDAYAQDYKYTVRFYSDADLVSDGPNYQKIVCGDESYAKLVELTDEQRMLLLAVRDDCFDRLRDGRMHREDAQSWLKGEFDQILLPSQMQILNDVATVKHLEREMVKALANPSSANDDDDDNRDAKVAELLGIQISEWRELQSSLLEIGEDVQEKLTKLVMDELETSLKEMPGESRRAVADYLKIDSQQTTKFLKDLNLEVLIASRQAFVKSKGQRAIQHLDQNVLNHMLAVLSSDEIAWLELTEEQTAELRQHAASTFASSKRSDGSYSMRLFTGPEKDIQRIEKLKRIAAVLLPHQLKELERIIAWRHLRIQLFPDFIESKLIRQMTEMSDRERSEFRQAYLKIAEKSLDEMKKIQDETRSKIVEVLPASLKPSGSVTWFRSDGDD